MSPQERILALDIGERRIGLAWADPGGTYALPGGFLELRPGQDPAPRLKELILDERVGDLVVGLPFNMDGSESAGVRKVRALLETLASLLVEPIRVHLWDERLTSHAAQGLLVEAGLKHSGKRRRGRVDAVAAALILQGWLDSRPSDHNLITRTGIPL